ncbi:D-alanyl-D-alanine carboxypeptidase [Proteobacteria bacterium 005FR1]|nr:D-alanyl-D-alanine carboxypeptidase [Proteobacteria bacterium 005FR1]
MIRRFCLVSFLAFAIFCNAGALYAAALPALKSPSYVLIDAGNGSVLTERDADSRMEPASLTKLMTAYIVFDELENERLRLDDLVTVSERAWRMPGSRTFLEPRSRVPVEALLKGLIVQSGNDAAIALAEHIAGSEAAFVRLMNEHAEALGMTNTHFLNPHGLPRNGHYSSARDLALLAVARLQRFPAYSALFAMRDFTWNNINQLNRNRLLWRDPSVNGLKTGYTARARYCQAASAERDGVRLIAVLLGAPTPGDRTREAQALLDYGFSVGGGAGCAHCSAN